MQAGTRPQRLRRLPGVPLAPYAPPSSPLWSVPTSAVIHSDVVQTLCKHVGDAAHNWLTATQLWKGWMMVLAGDCADACWFSRGFTSRGRISRECMPLRAGGKPELTVKHRVQKVFGCSQPQGTPAHELIVHSISTGTVDYGPPIRHHHRRSAPATHPTMLPPIKLSAMLISGRNLHRPLYQVAPAISWELQCIRCLDVRSESRALQWVTSGGLCTKVFDATRSPESEDVCKYEIACKSASACDPHTLPQTASVQNTEMILNFQSASVSQSHTEGQGVNAEAATGLMTATAPSSQQLQRSSHHLGSRERLLCVRLGA